MNGTLSASAGVAFSPSIQLKPPRLLPSGTGPSAPPIQSTTPTIIELVDWTDPNNPVVVGTANLNIRVDDWVFEDAEMAAEIGDVAVYQVDNTIKWTSPAANERFELGGILLVAANYNTQNGTIQLEQMLLGFKPLGRWATYPFQDTFVGADFSKSGGPDAWPANNPTTADTTIMPPFKINLKTATGAIVFTHEMKAHNGVPAMPINSPLLAEATTTPTTTPQPSGTTPLRPWFNCGMLLPWQNTRTRASLRDATLAYAIRFQGW
jgi:hypothetical protein